MDCLDCGSKTVSFDVPEDQREFLPGTEPGAALCTNCLALHPAEDPPAGDPSFDAVSPEFPDDADTAVSLALLLGLLDNLALYRAEITELLERVERGGTDPLLVLDRLAHDQSVDSAVDLAGRRRQLEQLL